MTEIGKPKRQWEDEPLQEPTPGQPVVLPESDPVPLDPSRVDEPAEIDV